MKKLKVYEYANCSTCKKALKFLESNQVSFETIPIVDSPPTPQELRTMLNCVNGNVGKLFNTSGVLYREMKISEKLKTLSVDEAIELLAKNGKLIKRPFAISEQQGRVGFNETEWKAFF